MLQLSDTVNLDIHHGRSVIFPKTFPDQFGQPGRKCLPVDHVCQMISFTQTIQFFMKNMIGILLAHHHLYALLAMKFGR